MRKKIHGNVLHKEKRGMHKGNAGALK